MFQKNSVYPKTAKQLFTIDFCILNKSIKSHNKKSLQKLLNTQQEKLSLVTRSCSLPTFKANETITNIKEYELSQEESDLLQAGSYFLICPDKIPNPISLLPLKRFIVRLLETLNPRNLKIR